MSSPERPFDQHDALEDFDARKLTFLGQTRSVYVSGTGPAVIVMAEIPGITPKVVEFADRVVDGGCTAVLPSLFGTPGAPVSNRAAPGIPNRCSRSPIGVGMPGRPYDGIGVAVKAPARSMAAPAIIRECGAG